jgi:lipoprotein-anchoring transpeptidase ErfK/SrfK
VNIDKTAQRMTVSVDGQTKYVGPVSTGGRHDTPSGTYTASSMNEVWYSKQWDSAAMPHSIFFTKQGMPFTVRLRCRSGRPVSHGCVAVAGKCYGFVLLVGAQDLNETTIVIAGHVRAPDTS